MVKYELIKGELSDVIKRTDEDGKEWWIPINEANADYQAYLDRDKPKAALSTPIVSSDAD